MSDVDCLLEQLTQNAIEAAQNGKWDQVIVLYNRRLWHGQQKYISPETAYKLVEWDQWLVARVQEAGAALQQNLIDIQDHRRKLEVLKRQWGGNSNVEGRHLLTA